MDGIEEFVDFVKDQGAFHARQAEKFGADERRRRLHQETSRKFDELCSFLLRANEMVSTRPVNTHRLGISWHELEGLPPELLEELSITDSDRLDYTIVEIMSNLGGVATLDRILIDLYRTTGEIMKRQNLNARLYRMAQKDLVYSVPGKKGVYSTAPVLDEDLQKLI